MASISFEGNYSLPAAADLTGSQFRFVVINGSAQVALCGAAAVADGILSNAPAVGEAARYDYEDGVFKVVCGPVALGAGVEIGSDAVGRAVAAISGQPVLAKTIDAANPGDIFRVQYKFRGLKA